MNEKELRSTYKEEIEKLRNNIYPQFVKLKAADKIALKYKVKPETVLERRIANFVNEFRENRVKEGIKPDDAQKEALTIVKIALEDRREKGTNDLKVNKNPKKLDLSRYVWIILGIFIIGIIITFFFI